MHVLSPGSVDRPRWCPGSHSAVLQALAAIELMQELSGTALGTEVSGSTFCDPALVALQARVNLRHMLLHHMLLHASLLPGAASACWSQARAALCRCVASGDHMATHRA